MLRTGPSGRIMGSTQAPRWAPSGQIDTVEPNLDDQTKGTVRGRRQSLSNHPSSSKMDKAPSSHSLQEVFITSTSVTLEEERNVYIQR